jgi:hypothetical protein
VKRLQRRAALAALDRHVEAVGVEVRVALDRGRLGAGALQRLHAREQLHQVALRLCLALDVLRQVPAVLRPQREPHRDLGRRQSEREHAEPRADREDDDLV